MTHEMHAQDVIRIWLKMLSESGPPLGTHLTCCRQINHWTDAKRPLDGTKRSLVKGADVPMLTLGPKNGMARLWSA